MEVLLSQASPLQKSYCNVCMQAWLHKKSVKGPFIFYQTEWGGGFRREVTGKHCHKFSETSATRAGSFCQRTSYTKWVVLCKMLIKNNFSRQDRVCRTGRKFDECDNTHRILRSCTSLSPLSIYHQLTYFTSMTNPKFYEL